MTAAESGDALRAKVRPLLNDAVLAGVAFSELSMARRDVEQPLPDVQYPVDVEIRHQATDDGMAYRVAIKVERPDIHVFVAVVVVYQVKDPSSFQDSEVAQAFGQLVALPAAYPYARAKLQEITLDSGVPPVFLGVLDMTRMTSIPAADDAEAGQTEAG